MLCLTRSVFVVWSLLTLFHFPQCSSSELIFDMDVYNCYIRSELINLANCYRATIDHMGVILEYRRNMQSGYKNYFEMFPVNCYLNFFWCSLLWRMWIYTFKVNSSIPLHNLVTLKSTCGCHGRIDNWWKENIFRKQSVKVL